MADYSVPKIAELVERGKEEQDILMKTRNLETAQMYCRNARSNLLFRIGDLIFDSTLTTCLLMTYPQEVHQDKPIYAAASLLLGYYLGKRSCKTIVKNLPDAFREHGEAKQACGELQRAVSSLEQRIVE